MPLPTSIVPTFDNGLVAFNGGESQLPRLRDDCVGLWAPIAGPTGPKLIDISGYGRDLDFENVTAANGWKSGQPGSVLDFDNTSNQRAIGDFPDIDPPLTLIWYGLLRNINNHWLVTLNNNAANQYYHLICREDFVFCGGLANFRARTYNGTIFDGGGFNAVKDKFLCVVAVWTGTVQQIYVDGRPGSCPLTTGARAGPIEKVIIGADQPGAGDLNGQTAFAAVISRALTESETALLADNPLGMIRRRKIKIITAGAPPASIQFNPTAADVGVESVTAVLSVGFVLNSAVVDVGVETIPATLSVGATIDFSPSPVDVGFEALTASLIFGITFQASSVDIAIEALSASITVDPKVDLSASSVSVGIEVSGSTVIEICESRDCCSKNPYDDTIASASSVWK